MVLLVPSVTDATVTVSGPVPLELLANGAWRYRVGNFPEEIPP